MDRHHLERRKESGLFRESRVNFESIVLEGQRDFEREIEAG